MKRISPLFLFFSLLIGSAFGQAIAGKKDFPAGGSVNATGYPSKIVAGAEDEFVFVEYWNGGKSGRRESGHYIQAYGVGWEEQWFEPISRPGPLQMKFQDIFRMKSNIAVIGTQYSASIKRTNTMAQFFSVDGNEVGGPVKISNFDKKAKKGFVEEMALSADNSKLLWMAHNPDKPAKSRRYFFSVTGDDGRPVWNKELSVPHQDDKYYVKQSAVDSKGNLYLLLTYESFTNTPKDTVNAPYVARYDYREKKWTENKLEFPGASVPEARIHITKDQKLYVMGIIADGSEAGFVNGVKAYGEGLKWNKLVSRKFKIERELEMMSDNLLDMPEAWITKYKDRGANFSKSDIVEGGGRLFWVLEEFYTQIHNKQLQHLYYDVATVALNMKSGEIDWANNFEKKQRDYNSGRLLSYTAGYLNETLQFVYLNERGAQGYIVCQTMNANSGKVEFKRLVQNADASWLFFPGRSTLLPKGNMMLMGVGNPVGNDYRLVNILFK